MRSAYEALGGGAVTPALTLRYVTAAKVVYGIDELG